MISRESLSTHTLDMTVDPDDQAEAVLAKPLSWKITTPAAVLTVYSWECSLDSGL